MNIKVKSKLLALQQKRKDKGATILEIIIFMGLAAFIVLMVMQGSTQATDNQKVGAEVQNLNTLKTSIRQMFSTQRVYTGLNNTVLLASSNFPEQMRVATAPGAIASGWQNEGVVVAEANVTGSAGSGFSITYTGIPREACVDILDRTYRHFMEVSVGTDDVTGGIAAIRTACKDADDGNTLIFKDK